MNPRDLAEIRDRIPPEIRVHMADALRLWRDGGTETPRITAMVDQATADFRHRLDVSGLDESDIPGFVVGVTAVMGAVNDGVGLPFVVATYLAAAGTVVGVEP